MPQCRHKGRHAKPWTYATTRSFEEVVASSREFPWLHLCRICIGYCQCDKCKSRADNGYSVKLESE